MKQIAFLIDVAWLQDEETTVAFRFGGLQLITTWPPDTCKFGYLLFNSESSRAQKVDAAGFFKPTTNAVEEFEAKLSEGIASSRKADSVSQIETLRWAVSRSITDLGWHAVSVTSPVKASRKRRQTAQRLNEPESRNMLFLFSRLPPGSLTKIRDELVTPSLGKCLQENRIELFWAHDSLQQSTSTSSKCVFLRIRDLVQLCGVFPTEQLQYSASLGPRSKIVSFLLQKSKSQPLAKCELNMNNLYNPIELSIFSNQSESTTAFDCADGELEFDGLQQEPTVTSILEKSVAIFTATSPDVHFHRLLMELRSLNSVCFLKCGETKFFLLKPMADSVAALVQITSKDLVKNVDSESSAKLFDSFYLERSCPGEPSNDEVSVPSELLSRIQAAYKNRKPLKVIAEVAPVQEQTEEEASESFQEEPSAVGFTSEESLLQQMRLTHERSVSGRLSAVVAAQSIVSATVHFFQNEVSRIKSFLLENFPVPLDSNRPSEEWANECLIFILICFELVSLSPPEADSVKANVVSAMRKVLFLTSPSKLFDFIQETLKNLYIETARPLLEDIADTFDSPLVADSDDEIELPGSSISSLPEPLSGISSLGSATNSVPHSAPTKPKPAAVGGDPLRRMSSANLSQRQIQIPKRRNVKEQPTTSPVKRASSSRSMPTTPRGRRILKTQVVPETPVGKQAPGRVRRTQETLRRQSSILNSSSQGEEETVMEVDESPLKGTPVKSTPKKTPRTTPLKTPRTSPRKHLTRKLMFSPQKKTFTSPTAISLLHLTTSPVLFKPNRRKPS